MLFFSLCRIAVYVHGLGTNPPGDVSLEEKGGIYLVKTNLTLIAEKTRGIKFAPKKDGKQSGAEFAESVSLVRIKGR